MVSRKRLSEKHHHYYDSLMQMKYDRVLPIFGERVYKKGFDIPFPFGIMLNSFYGKQTVDISNVRIGVKSADTVLGPADLSKILEFGAVNAKAYNLNLRMDAWIFPFLDVYALLAWLPSASTYVHLTKPVDIVSDPQQHGWAWGLGVMGAGGIGPVWLQSDYSLTWATMQLLENKVFTQVIGLRTGHVFTSGRSAEKNFSMWVGVMGIFINNQTVGQISLSSAFPGISQEKLDEIRQSYSNWYEGVGPLQQQVSDKIVQKLQDKINGLSAQGVYVTYELDKKLRSNWAGLAGAQYQFNKRWQLRAESNFVGPRFSILTSVNYRFLGVKKNKHL
jgi:hypothetical protein